MTISHIVDGQAGLPVPNSTKSYWHQSPSQKLFGHRTTPELPETADIIIIGSGITGSFAAHFLKNGKGRDQKVVMLEAREACWGATGRNGGHCQPMVYGSSPNIASFELETYAFLKQFVQDNKISCDWRTVPGVHVALTQDVFDASVTAIALLQKHHPSLAAQCKVVAPRTSVQEVHQAQSQGQPTLTSLRIPHVPGAIVQQHAGSLWPYKLVCWVLEQLLEQFPAPSFNLQTNTPVTGLTRGPSGGWLLRTPRGPVAANTVLLCTNGYTSRLLPAFADLIVPVRGQVAALTPPRESKAAEPVQLSHTYVTLGHIEGRKDQDEYLVQRPLPTGEHILGGGRNVAKASVGVWRDDEIEESVSKWLKTHLTPPLDLKAHRRSMHDEVGTEQELPATFEWTGIMGYSRDQHAYVGPVPESMGGGGKNGGLWLCGGYTGHGMPVAPLSARAVVRMMTGDDDSTDGGGVSMPDQFLLTEERVRNARERFATVEEQDRDSFIASLPELFAAE